MKKLLSILMCLGIFGMASMASAEPISVKISMGSCPIGHPLLKAGEDLNSWIQEKSNGKYSVTLLPSGTIGAFDSVYQQTVMGSVPIAVETTSNLANFYPELSVFDVPYLFKGSEKLNAFLHSDVMKESLKQMSKSKPGISLVGGNNVSFRYVASNKQFTKLAELQGKKNRTSTNKLHVAAIAAMGMNPTPTAASEILSSLQQGVVDTTDVEIFWPLTARLYDVCKYYLEMDAMPVIYVTFVSDMWLKKLPEEDRAMWLEGLDWFIQQADVRLDEGRANVIEELKGKGCVFSALSEADKAEAAAKCANLGSTLRPNQQAFLEKIRASF